MLAILALMAVLFPLVSSAQEQADVKTDTTTTISAPSVNIYDDVQTYPEKVSLTQSPLALDLDFNLRKLPGALVTQYGGPGSTSTIISPIATGSGGTMVSIDGIPVVAPLGRGTDLTYFPPAFFGRVDWYSPFYPWAEGRIAPGGRLDMISRTHEKKDSTEILGEGLYGTGQTAQVSSLVTHNGKTNSYVVGLTGFRTEGTWNYVSPVDGSQQTRQFDDNKYLGLLLKDEYKFSEKNRVLFSGLTQIGHRTEPNSIVNQGGPSPTSAADSRDTFFGQAAVKFSSDDLWIDNTIQEWSLSHSADRSYYYGLTLYSPQTFQPTATGVSGSENGQGDLFSWSVKGKKVHDSFSAQLDGMYEKVETYYPLYADRQTVGMTLAYDAFKISKKDFVIPRVRVEEISAQQQQDPQTQADGSIGYIHEFEPGQQLFASASLLHKTPSMIALYGYLEGGLPVTGMPTLPVERTGVYSLGYNLVEKNHGLWLNTWYSHHNNMALRTTNNFGLGNFIQVLDAQTYGISGQFTCQFLNHWGALFSGSYEKTRNNDLSTELTFKPTYIGSSTLSYEIATKTNISVEDVYEGTRYFSASNSGKFPNGSTEPMNWTNLKSDIAVGPGSAYVKVVNIFNAAGFDNPGYPYPGISFWVGYSFMGDI